MEHWKCDGAGRPDELAAVCRERDELKAALDGAQLGLKALNEKLVEVTAERDALVRIIGCGIDACDHCTHNGSEVPCSEMVPAPDCEECTLEKTICCKCEYGSSFEFVGVEEEVGGE